MLFSTRFPSSLLVAVVAALSRVHAAPPTDLLLHKRIVPQKTCDAKLKDWAGPVYSTTEPVQFIAPGTGRCSQLGYRWSSNSACVHPSWTDNGGCGRWIRITNTATKTSADAQVRDTCGPPGDTAFKCSDIRVGRQTFATLSNYPKDKKKAAEAINSGNIRDPVEWNFQNTPCWACWAGLPGSLKTDGTAEDCKGVDSQGFTRCGIKTGKDRIVGDAVLEVCKKGYVCP